MSEATYVVKSPPEDETYGEQEERRKDALQLAVQHHGLANTAEKMIPARIDTVLATTDLFERYLRGEKVEDLTGKARQDSRDRNATGTQPHRGRTR